MKKATLTNVMAFTFSILLFATLLQHVESQSFDTIFIKSDGSVEGTDKIQRDGNICTFMNSIEGLILIEGNNIVLDGAGFTLQGEIKINGNNVEIKNLKIIAFDIAIEIYGSECKILNNSVQAEHIGIRICKDSNNNVISGNKIDVKVQTAIAFNTSSNNIVTENTFGPSIIEGVSLTHSDHNTFSGNNFNFVDIYHSSYNTFVGNNLPQGISIRSSSNYNTITGNSISDFNELSETSFLSSGSINVFSCEGNIISSNVIVNGGGIFLDTSSNNVLRNNAVSGKGVGFEVSGGPQPKLSSFINDIDDSNTINGKKIYYLINKRDLSIHPSNYSNIGYLALVNCTRMIVENNHLNTQGILLAWTTGSQIINNDISNNYGDGVILNYASNNKITKNNINANNGTGIRLSHSNQNIVSGNYITRNQEGIYLILSAENNTFTENNIAGQEIGISFHTSSSNLIYHNNFVNNTKQIDDASWGHPQFPGIPLPSENIWDNGYPIGGNYWNNYCNLYPEAKELDSSGIWETPYIIDENNQDRYPLVIPLDILPVQVPEAPDGETSTTSSVGSFPTTLVLGLIALVAIVGVVLLVYFKKRKR